VRVRQLNPRTSSERGAVALTVGLLLIPVSILLAFTLDIGNAMTQRQALSASADSAALAVADTQQAKALTTPNKTCAQLVSDDTALAAGSATKSSTIALNQVRANSGFGTTVQASDLTTTLSCTGTNSGYLQVAVRVNKTVPTTLGNFAGVSILNINRTATAAMGVSYKTSGYRPIGVCQYQAQKIISDAAASGGPPYPAELIALSKVWNGSNSCGTAGAGNWGWLDCGGGVSASTLGAELQSGCNQPVVSVGATLDGAPGNKGSSTPVHNGMDAVMDTTIELPVYDTFTDNGSNTTFHIVGFISLQVCGYDSSSKGACFDTTVGVGNNELQVRYSAYHAVGELKDGGCAIGSACAYSSLVTKLVG
jgi:Flp pilus assembly protein TadG